MRTLSLDDGDVTGRQETSFRQEHLLIAVNQRDTRRLDVETILSLPREFLQNVVRRKRFRVEVLVLFRSRHVPVHLLLRVERHPVAIWSRRSRLLEVLYRRRRSFLMQQFHSIDGTLSSEFRFGDRCVQDSTGSSIIGRVKVGRRFGWIVEI